jgi:hypothetical protein
LPESDVEKLASALAGHTLPPGAEPAKETVQLLVIISTDSLLIHSLEVLSRGLGAELKAFGSLEEFEAQAQAVMKEGIVLRTIIDAPANVNGASKSVLELQKSLSGRFQGAVMVQLVQGQSLGFTLDSYRGGVRTVLPKPRLQAGSATATDDFIGLVNFLPGHILSR